MSSEGGKYILKVFRLTLLYSLFNEINVNVTALRKFIDLRIKESSSQKTKREDDQKSSHEKIADLNIEAGSITAFKLNPIEMLEYLISIVLRINSEKRLIPSADFFKLNFRKSHPLSCHVSLIRITRPQNLNTFNTKIENDLLNNFIFSGNIQQTILELSKKYEIIESRSGTPSFGPDSVYEKIWKDVVALFFKHFAFKIKKGKKTNFVPDLAFVSAYYKILETRFGINVFEIKKNRTPIRLASISQMLKLKKDITRLRDIGNFATLEQAKFIQNEKTFNIIGRSVLMRTSVDSDLRQSKYKRNMLYISQKFEMMLFKSFAMRMYEGDFPVSIILHLTLYMIGIVFSEMEFCDSIRGYVLENILGRKFKIITMKPKEIMNILSLLFSIHEVKNLRNLPPKIDDVFLRLVNEDRNMWTKYQQFYFQDPEKFRKVSFVGDPKFQMFESEKSKRITLNRPKSTSTFRETFKDVISIPKFYIRLFMSILMEKRIQVEKLFLIENLELEISIFNRIMKTLIAYLHNSSEHFDMERIVKLSESLILVVLADVNKIYTPVIKVKDERYLETIPSIMFQYKE